MLFCETLHSSLILSINDALFFLHFVKKTTYYPLYKWCYFRYPDLNLGFCRLQCSVYIVPEFYLYSFNHIFKCYLSHTFNSFTMANNDSSCYLVESTFKQLDALFGGSFGYINICKFVFMNQSNSENNQFCVNILMTSQ